MRHHPHHRGAIGIGIGVARKAALIAGLTLVAGAAARAPFAAAADARVPSVTEFARMEADVARVQQELREQKQLILQLMQMHEALLKYVQMGGGATGSAGATIPSAGIGGSATAQGTAGTPVGAAAAPADEKQAARSGTARSFISGKVKAATAGSLAQAYVYVDGPKSLASRTASIEIKQAARQFVPAVAVVQIGTRVFFPNEDKVFHNVFSRTPGDAFDLGTLKAGDRPNPVTLLKPGHVEIFCNIHSKMRADVLVVPNSMWTRVRADGSFQLASVPLGVHRVVLWGPELKPVAQRVEVTAAGGSTTFSADTQSRRRHLNKQGGAYESYDE